MIPPEPSLEPGLEVGLELGRLSRGPQLPALVASSISREIAEGRLRAGDRLPSEQALSVTFGVSRQVVREAIARLRFEGIIWSHQGRGAFVCETSPPAVLTMDLAGLPPADAFRHLFELRGMIEVPAAALAAQVCDADDLHRMRLALDAMLGSPYASVGWLDGDLDFHRAVAAATHNPYVEQVIGFVAGRVRESVLASGHQQGSDRLAGVTHGEHERILEAIASRRPAVSEAAMRSHLAGAARRVGLGPVPAQAFNRQAAEAPT